MLALGIIVIILLVALSFHWVPKAKPQPVEPTATSTPETPQVIQNIVNVSSEPKAPKATVPVTQTTPQTAPSAPQQAPAPQIIIIPSQSPMPQPQPTPVPSSSPSASPSTSSPATSTPATSTPPTQVPNPTEEEAKPVIKIDGNRVGIVVTFTWSATGFKEPLQCKANGEPVEQEGTLVVESVQPYTLTIVCVGKNTASRSEESLTK